MSFIFWVILLFCWDVSSNFYESYRQGEVLPSPWWETWDVDAISAPLAGQRWFFIRKRGPSSIKAQMFLLQLSSVPWKTIWTIQICHMSFKKSRYDNHFATLAFLDSRLYLLPKASNTKEHTCFWLPKLTIGWKWFCFHGFWCHLQLVTFFSESARAEEFTNYAWIKDSRVAQCKTPR